VQGVLYGIVCEISKTKKVELGKGVGSVNKTVDMLDIYHPHIKNNEKVV
jgi:hypothetical protein